MFYQCFFFIIIIEFEFFPSDYAYAMPRKLDWYENLGSPTLVRKTWFVIKELKKYFLITFIRADAGRG